MANALWLIAILIVIFLILGCSEFDPLLLWHENLPICDMREPLKERCREVRGVWGGQTDGKVWDPLGYYHERPR